MKKGESVRVKNDYDLFGYNAKDYTGVYVAFNKKTKKNLVYFPDLKEWGEFTRWQLKRVDPGVVDIENQELVSRVKTMKYTTTEA